MENLKMGFSVERKPASHRQLFKPEKNEESTSEFLARKIQEHNENDHKRFAIQYNFDTKLNQPFSPNITFNWVRTETAPKFYHETTAKSKSQRIFALNFIGNLVKNMENQKKNVLVNFVTLKRTQRPLSANVRPKLKQLKNGLSQRIINKDRKKYNPQNN